LDSEAKRTLTTIRYIWIVLCIVKNPEYWKDVKKHIQG
jgi:hypothetical protein